jgi:hypothetical protein
VEENSLVHNFEGSHASKHASKLIVVLLVAGILGVGSGYILANAMGKSSTINGSTASSSENLSSIGKGTVVGSNDTATFKDTAEGVLENGGVDGEGQFHLVRPGGESQYVYLTSSSVDLSKFLKKKVRVAGQTQKAQKAGWLMDVGRLEVLE